MHRARVAVLVLSALVGAASPTDACGDKFLLVGQGALFPRGYVAAHPARVLVYLPNAKSSDRDAGRDIVRILNRAGHRATVAAGAAALETALRTPPDVLVASLSALEAAVSTVLPPAKQPVLVPVASRRSLPDSAATMRRYRFVVDPEQPVTKFLAAIDAAMADRLARAGGTH